MKLPIIDSEFFAKIHDRNRSMMSFDKMLNLYYLLIDTLDKKIPGEFLEVGAYKGYSAILIQKILTASKDERKVIIFDSFEGLPEKSQKDYLDKLSLSSRKILLDNQRINKGWFKSSKQTLIDNFKLFKISNPKIIEGWFSETLVSHLPEKIAFAHLDGDFYSSTKIALENIFPKMPEGGLILLDDYCSSNALPGVKIACDEYLEDKLSKVKILPTLANQHQAVLIKGEKPEQSQIED